LYYAVSTVPRKTQVLTLRVDPVLAARWRAAARAAGVPLSQFVRAAVNERLKTHTPPVRMAIDLQPRDAVAPAKVRPRGTF